MKRTVTQVLILSMIVGLSSQAAWAQTAVFSMKVVEINGSTAGLPSTNVSVNPGDVVKIEAFLVGWAPEELASYQFAFDVASMDSGGGSPLALTEIPCGSGADCPVSGLCDLGAGACQCTESLFIDTSPSRFDFVFFNGAVIAATNCFGAQLQAGAVLIVNAGGSGQTDNGTPRYLGTAVMTIPSDGCGVYTLEFDQNLSPQQTFATNVNGIPITVDASASITMSVNAACPTGCEVIASAFPPDCEVDARQPHPLNDANTPFGFDSVEITFADMCDPASLGTSDFTTEQVPFSLFPPPPQVIGVTALNADTVRVDLDRPISPGKWTCIKLASDPTQKTCVGYLPGDVNADLTSAPSDILAVIDSLNGVTPRPDFATDADRSGQAGPEDILRVIDLLNGAAALDVWLDETLPACP